VQKVGHIFDLFEIFLNFYMKINITKITKKNKDLLTFKKKLNTLP